MRGEILKGFVGEGFAGGSGRFAVIGFRGVGDIISSVVRAERSVFAFVVVLN